MTTAEPLRDEHFYPLPQKLSARILKYPLGLRIRQDNLARSVNHHYGVRRRLDNNSEAPLGDLSFRLVRVVEILAVRVIFTLAHPLTCRPADCFSVEVIPFATHLRFLRRSHSMLSSGPSNQRQGEERHPAGGRLPAPRPGLITRPQNYAHIMYAGASRDNSISSI